MLQTTRLVEEVAERIERAYLRRRPEWRAASLDRRLWTSAANLLLEAHRLDESVPLDPELFVASQVRPGLTSDPWMDLTRSKARDRYLSQVRKIVRGIRRELLQEIRRAESGLRKGEAIEVVLLAPSRRMTALGRFLAAVRMGRPDLADRLRDGAREQHWACPLYRSAAKDLVADEDYPVVAASTDLSRPAGMSPFSSN